MSTSEQVFGRDLDSARFWGDEATAYQRDLNHERADYHRGRLATAERLLASVAPGRVLDFGCGDGAFAIELAQRGFAVTGMDIAPKMVALAKSATAEIEFSVGGAGDLKSLEAGSLDGIVSLNVLAYLTDREMVDFWAGARHVLAPGGWLLLSHSNELFDLFALNAGTAAFFARHFTGGRGVGSLLADTDPQDATYNIRANPLNYRETLATQGFEEIVQAFFNLHPAPPPLLGDGDSGRVFDRDEIEKTETWKQMFQCSTYFSFSSRLAPTKPSAREDEQVLIAGPGWLNSGTVRDPRTAGRS